MPTTPEVESGRELNADARETISRAGVVDPRGALGDSLPDLAPHLRCARAHINEAQRAIIGIGRLASPWEDRRIRALFCCLNALHALRAERDALIAAHWRRIQAETGQWRKRREAQERVVAPFHRLRSVPGRLRGLPEALWRRVTRAESNGSQPRPPSRSAPGGPRT